MPRDGNYLVPPLLKLEDDHIKILGFKFDLKLKDSFDEEKSKRQ
jgi:hypothetical protein